MTGRKSDGPKAKTVEEDFDGGPLPWNPDEKTTAKTDFRLGLLTWLSSPVRQGLVNAYRQQCVDGSVRLFAVRRLRPLQPVAQGRRLPP